MNTRALTIATLYPAEMNIYGDHGNLEFLVRRAELYGFKIDIVVYEPGNSFPNDVDIVLGGGGQDSGQTKITDDLMQLAPKLHKLAEDGVSMLVICGLYQLFGHYFLTNEGVKIPGISLFDAYTSAGSKRLIGNIVTNWNGYKIVGYENHSGLTYLNGKQTPFSYVEKGAGNNGKDDTEGVRIHNVFGSYLHGPILPKNPRFTDELLLLAARRRFGDNELSPADVQAKKTLQLLNDISKKARTVAMNRPR